MTSINPNVGNDALLRMNAVKKVKEEKTEKAAEQTENKVTVQQADVTLKEVDASALDVMANLIKGEMGLDEVHKEEDMQGPRSGEDVQELIDLWNANNKTMTREEKMRFLTRIIDLYHELGDTVHENIWRVRRYTTACSHVTENIGIWNNLVNNGVYTTPYQYYPVGYAGNTSSPDDKSYDEAAMTDFFNGYCNNQLTDEEEIVYREYVMSREANWALRCMIHEKHNPSTYNSQYKGLIKQAVDNVFNYMNNIASNPLTANEEWQETYNAVFLPAFNNLKDNIAELSQSDIETMARNLRGMIGDLRDQGFPYCDELLTVVQGYLFYAGSDMNVLSIQAPINPGGAAPSVVDPDDPPEPPVPNITVPMDVPGNSTPSVVAPDDPPELPSDHKIPR